MILILKKVKKRHGRIGIERRYDKQLIFQQISVPQIYVLQKHLIQLIKDLEMKQLLRFVFTLKKTF